MRVLGMLGVFGAAIAVAAKSAPACHATPTQDTAGPVYKMGVPKKNTVCDTSAHTTYVYRANPAFCMGEVCLARRKVELGRTSALHVTGTVRDADSCKPIPEVEIEVYQTNEDGRYGSLHPNEEDGFCRAVVMSGKDGKFAFDTVLPGMYGITNGALAPYDFPPFAPQHIHVLIEAPGYKVLTTQLYFEDDPALTHDWRFSLQGKPLGTNETDLQLKPTHCGEGFCVHTDFVMVKSPENKGLTKQQKIHAAVCDTSVPAIAVCHPEAFKFVRWYIIAPCLLLVLGVASMVTARVVKMLLRGLQSKPKQA